MAVADKFTDQSRGIRVDSRGKPTPDWILDLIERTTLRSVDLTSARLAASSDLGSGPGFPHPVTAQFPSPGTVSADREAALTPTEYFPVNAASPFSFTGTLIEDLESLVTRIVMGVPVATREQCDAVWASMNAEERALNPDYLKQFCPSWEPRPICVSCESPENITPCRTPGCRIHLCESCMREHNRVEVSE